MSISTFRTLAFVAFAVITAPLFSQGTCEIEGLFGPPPSSCGNPVTFDGYDYATVQIGDQCWFSENLRSDHYRNGDPIPGNLHDTTWSSTVAGAQAYYNNDAGNLSEYGRLYNWYAVDDARGLCPSGWHVASYDEYMTLTNFLGGGSVAGGKMKEAGTTHWSSVNTGGGAGSTATNSSGFTAFGSGYRSHFQYANLLNVGYFWTSTPAGVYGYFWTLHSYNTSVNIQGGQQVWGLAVRCEMD
jgi:uncharacterized protein (TIGR02145 family)